MSPYQVNERQGRITLVAGVALVLLGFVLQAINAHSVVTGPPFSDGGSSTVLLGEISGFVILCGLILTVVGIIRYAQSGSVDSSMIVPAPAEQMGAAAPGGHVSQAKNRVRPSTSAFCSSCGSQIVGVGRYCASCGTPTAS